MTIVAITDSDVLLLSTISKLAKKGEFSGAELDSAMVITQASILSKLPLDSSSVDIVVGVSKNRDFPSLPLLSELFRVAKLGGKFLIYLTELGADLPSERILSSLQGKIFKVGFSEPETIEQPLNVYSGVQVLAIDEDSLLTEEVLKKTQLPPLGDCEVGTTTKACKNCVCGRAEAEEKVEKLGTTMDLLQSGAGCGSCGLGDAFRCGTCPYKGQPPFKPGEKVVLSLTADSFI